MSLVVVLKSFFFFFITYEDFYFLNIQNIKNIS